jgi:hypothetical protein
MTKKILTENHPRIAKDWDIEKNSPLLPEQVSSYSRYIIWWCCSENHKYQVSVYSRVRSNGCKVCQASTHSEKMRLTKLKNSNSLKKSHPELISEWDIEKNQSMSPDTVSYRSKKKYGGNVIMVIHGLQLLKVVPSALVAQLVQ